MFDLLVVFVFIKSADLDEVAVSKKFLHTADDGKKYLTNFVKFSKLYLYF